MGPKKKARGKDLEEDNANGGCDRKSSSWSWIHLPDELWMIIFRHLTPKELASVSMTCRSLHTLCQDPSLWTHITIDWQSIKNKTQSSEMLMSRSEKLSHLTITNRTFEQVNSPLIMSVVKKAKDSVTHLVLTPEIALGNTALSKVTSLTNLVCLELAGDWIKSSGTAAIGSLTNLEELKMPGAEQVTPKDMKDMFSSLTKLRLVDVSECKKGVTDMSVIALVTHNTGLQYLALDECELVTGKSIKVLADKCPELYHLSLDGCYQVNDPSMVKISTQCVQLSYLSLSLCSTVKDSTLTKLGANCPHVTFLNLFGCAYLSERGIDKYVKTAKKLKHLDIRGILGIGQAFSERLAKEYPDINIVHQFGAKPPRSHRIRLLSD